MYSISFGLYTCTIYHLVYIHVQYITWFIYMYSISFGLYTCTIYHLVYIHVQYSIVQNKVNVWLYEKDRPTIWKRLFSDQNVYFVYISN